MFEVAEKPFDAERQTFRGGIAADQRRTDEQIMAARCTISRSTRVAWRQRPSCRRTPCTAPRIAFMHTWLATQTEGWWRYAFDTAGVPFDYISTQTVAKEDDLRAKYDVIVFAPVGRVFGAGHHQRHADVGQRDAVAEDRI